jgi:hypothetical protein
MYTQNDDFFDIDRTEVYTSKDGRNYYIEFAGTGNGNGPSSSYIKLSAKEFEHIKNLITHHAIVQGTEDFADRFDDEDDDWPFS